jgi:hypothetical protein
VNRRDQLRASKFAAQTGTKTFATDRGRAGQGSSAALDFFEPHRRGACFKLPLIYSQATRTASYSITGDASPALKVSIPASPGHDYWRSAWQSPCLIARWRCSTLVSRYPNQYAAVVKHFAPIYRPELIILEFFVNDYQDVLRSDETFRASRLVSTSPSSDMLHFFKLPYLKRPIQLELIQAMATPSVRTGPLLWGTS